MTDVVRLIDIQEAYRKLSDYPNLETFYIDYKPGTQPTSVESHISGDGKFAELICQYDETQGGNMVSSDTSQQSTDPDLNWTQLNQDWRRRFKRG